MANIFEERAKLYKAKKTPVNNMKKEEVPIQPEILEQNKGFFPSLLRGLKGGSSGVLLGESTPEQPQQQSALEHISSLGGEVVSDIPVMSAGAMLGSVLGPIGSAIGAFALPALLKTSRRETEKLFESSDGPTIRGGLEALFNVGKETVKSGTIGAVTAGAGKFAPMVSKIPGISKLAKSNLGRAAIEAGLEYGGITGGQSLVEGELPSKQQLVDNALVLGGFKVARGLAQKGKESAKKVAPIFKERYEKFKESEAKTNEYFDKLKEYTGEKDVAKIKTKFKWKRELEKAESSGKFSPQDKNDMLYYRQRTGNPNIKNDTHAKCAKRLPEHAKEYVDKDVDNYFAKSLVDWNQTVADQQLRPRAVLEHTFLPAFYEYNPKGFAKAAQILKTKHPGTHAKTFLTYHEAAKKAGLVPKHKDIFSLLNAHENLINKLKANIKLVGDINQIQEDSGGALVVRSNDPVSYKQAEANGYKKFMDPLLRRYKDPKTEKFELSPKPALVEPEFAKAFQGVFAQDPYKSDPFALKKYDKLSNEIRNFLIQGSLFHYGAITESSIGALGFKGVRYPTLMREGKQLRTNEMFMRSAARAGLNLSSGIDNYRKGFTLIDRLLDKGLAKTNPKDISNKTLKVLGKAQGYLFDQFQPNIKAVTFNDLGHKYLTQEAKAKGKVLTIEEGNKVLREVASTVNDMYGGQKWETQRVFNSPQSLKWLRRGIGYGDWSVSAIKQASLPFKTGIQGQIGRRYWLKWGLGMTAVHAAQRWLNSGFGNDKETGRPNWSLDKANESMTGGDPTAWWKVPLPDVNITIGGKTINTGRDEKGRRLYMHGGKQGLEIARYFTDPFNALFSKSNPLIRMAFKQVMGGTPWGERLFIEGGKYKYGEQKPWDATDPFTLSRFGERVKSVAKDLVPFGVSNLINKGKAPWALSAFGSFPISKGMNVYTATPYIEKALINKDSKQLQRIVDVLEDNKIDPTSIKRRLSMVRNSLKLDGKIRGLKLNETITNNAITKSIKDKNINKINAVIKSLKLNGYSQDVINKKILSIEDKLKMKKADKVNINSYINA